MRVEIDIVGIAQNEVGTRVFGRLSELYPEGAYNGHFGCKLFEDDVTIREIIAVLRDAGFSPWNHISRQPGPREYWERWNRIYDDEDLTASEFLVPRAAKITEGLSRAWPKPARLEYGHISHGVRVTGSGSLLVIMDQLAKQFSDEGFLRSSFLPISVNEDKAWTIDRYLQISSDYVLPRLSPKCILKDTDGRIFDDDYSKGCILREGLFSTPELHYTRKAADRFEPFDIALTHERFGNGDRVCYPELVVSKRFYEFCKKKKLKMDWTPVRIDAD